MNELVKLICEKTGLAEEQATKAAETVVAFLKARLPAPLAMQIDSAINGAQAVNKLAEAAKGLRGMFGS
jgi:hypothetical protein